MFKINKIIVFFLVIFLSKYAFFYNAYWDLTPWLFSWTAVDLWWGRVWTNTINATWDTTNTFATNTVPRSTNTNQIVLRNFWFNNSIIPDWAQINGISVLVERRVNNTNMMDSVVQLTKNGTTLVWLNRWNNANWPTTKQFTTYGWINDLWWTTWTTAELFSPNFWVVLQYRNTAPFWWWNRTAEIYRVVITIDYTILWNPGWVSNNLSLWFKSNSWTSTTINWANLTSWIDQSWNTNNATSVVAPTYLNNQNDNLNYYPLINFTWWQYLQWLNNWWFSDSYFMVIVPNQIVDWTVSWQVPFWFDCDSWILSSGTCWLPFSWLTLWAFTVAIADEVITHAIWSSANWRSAQVWNSSYEALKPMLLSVNTNQLINWTDIYEKWQKIDNFSVNNYQRLSNANFSIGRSLDWSNPFPYNWRVAEIINFSSRLSDNERQRIESYLSIKYGITLNNWDQNYLDSNWNIIYNINRFPSYNNNIFAIWRDDDTLLWQVQSKSVNNWTPLSIELQWQWTNLSPNFTSLSDLEFLFIWDNNWSNTWISSNSPTWYNVLDRKWIVQETWDTWNKNLYFDVWNSDFNIPNLDSWTNYYFVYDSNNNWDLSDETPISMINTSWNIWWVFWVNLWDWNIFTIATESSWNNIPTDIILSNNSIDENIPVWTTVWVFSTLDIDSSDTHTYSLVSWFWDSDNIYFSISWNNLLIQESPDFEIKNTYNIRIQTDDWNWWQFQKSFQINILNLAETINSIIDFETPWKYSVTSWTWNRLGNSVFEWSFSLESWNTWIPNSQACFEVVNTFSWIWTIDFKYRVSSQAWADLLTFYINNVEQQSWSWNIAWSTYTKNDVPAGQNIYKWCYIKDWATNSFDDKVYIDYITFFDTNPDNNPPVITWTNFWNNSILPWRNHSIIVDYFDIWTWIDTSSAVITLNKWNWSAWWTNISSFYLSNNFVTTTQASYNINDLDFWRYRYIFQIRDNYWNITSVTREFYIDEPELFINTWSYLSSIWMDYSPDEIVATVRTIWAPFNLYLLKDTSFSDGRWNIIADYDSWIWVWYDMSPYWNLQSIISNPLIWSQTLNLSTSWNLNEYIYVFKIWTLINEEQAAWTYNMSLSFDIVLNY